MIVLERLTIRQGSFAFTDVQLEVPRGAYAILMGATGSGKTTLVEAICGLRPVQSGKLLVDGIDITRAQPFDRNIGYVPQDSVLFPTMRIENQIEFGLEVRKVPKDDRKQRVRELADLMGIDQLLGRFPKGLSGGERQRVALARALAMRPQLLCLDEPLSALDDRTKSQIAALLKRIHERENVTILHITHNSSEALELGTIHFRIQDGSVKQTELQEAP